MAENTTGQSAAATRTTPKLFVRQSSGLVRNVSVTNALFFNVAGFVGVGLTLYPIFYSLAGVPVWEVPLVLRNLQITARIIGIGAGGHFFTHARESGTRGGWW